jgi:hypothetical protein
MIEFVTSRRMLIVNDATNDWRILVLKRKINETKRKARPRRNIQLLVWIGHDTEFLYTQRASNERAKMT